MNFLIKFFMLVLATLVLLFALVFISLYSLTSAIRWLITGKRPTFVLYVQAYQRWKNLAKGTTVHQTSNPDIIDAEVREVTKDNDRLR